MVVEINLELLLSSGVDNKAGLQELADSNNITIEEVIANSFKRILRKKAGIQEDEIKKLEVKITE